MKYCLMSHGTVGLGTGGFRIAARSLGRDLGVGEGDGFTFLEKLSFFRMDVLVALLLPLAFLVFARLLRPRRRLLAASILSTVITVALYVQFRAFQSIGQYVSMRMLVAALSWGWREPATYSGYLGIKGLLLILAAAVCIGIGLWRSPRHEQKITRQPGWESGTAGVACLAAFCLLFLLPLPWLPRLQSTPYQRSLLVTALAAYFDTGDVGTREFADLTTSELLTRYRELTHTPTPQVNSNYWGKSKGSNVFFFVFETLPARFLPAEGNLDDLPNIRRLRRNSFVALQHYSVYPNTHQALFALLSSWYPSGVTKTFEEQYPDNRIPGMMRTLSHLGYYTAVYSPDSWDGFLDQEMFQSLGVQRQVFPPNPNVDLDTFRRTRKVRDEATLSLMKQDLAQKLNEGRKFAAVFLPQLGHGPLLEGDNRLDEGRLRKREHEILVTQDAWLGEVLNLLKQYHQLDDSLIVVTGDHGIRSQEEDPSFATGMIDEYSFHVPLLIYAPRDLDHAVTIPWLTSHIDVAPTVLDLLGVKDGREYEEGTPLWNPGLAGRTTFFFAYAMFGADGYYSHGRFYMWNRLSGAAYEGRQLHFVEGNLSSRNSTTDPNVSSPIFRMIGFQQVWVSRFARSTSLRNHLFARVRAVK